MASGNLKEIYHLKDSGVDGRIILKWILRKCGLGSSGLVQGLVAGCCERRNEQLNFIGMVIS
jgi:hypothetical protein